MSESRELVTIEPASIGLPNGPQTNAAHVTDALGFAEARGCNVLAPLTVIDHIPPDHALALRVVRLPAHFDGQQDKARSNGYWYKVDGGNLALHRASLDQLAAAAGISTVSSKRVDDRSEPLVWEWEVTVSMKGMDGIDRTITRSKSLDLRDGAPETLKTEWGDKKGEKRVVPKSAQQLLGMRQHGAALCESKAHNRAVRAMLGIKGSYPPAEARAPFVFPRLTWQPNMEDPEIARLVAAKELGVVSQLYGSPQREPAPAGLLAHPDNVVDAPPVQGPQRRPAPRQEQRRQQRPDDGGWGQQRALTPEEMAQYEHELEG